MERYFSKNYFLHFSSIHEIAETRATVAPSYFSVTTPRKKLLRFLLSISPLTSPVVSLNHGFEETRQEEAMDGN